MPKRGETQPPGCREWTAIRLSQDGQPFPTFLFLDQTPRKNAENEPGLWEQETKKVKNTQNLAFFPFNANLAPARQTIHWSQFPFPSFFSPPSSRVCPPKFNADWTKATAGYFSNTLPQISSSRLTSVNICRAHAELWFNTMHSVAELVFFLFCFLFLKKRPKKKRLYPPLDPTLRRAAKKTAISMSLLAKLTGAQREDDPSSNRGKNI